VLRLWHLASLDAPTVAVVWSLAIAWVSGTHLPHWVVASLAITVWVIYVADRLLDSRRAVSTGCVEGLRERHFFHWRLRRVLVPAAGAAAACVACMVFAEMPAWNFERVSVVAAAALVYLRRVHFSDGSREDTRGLRSRLVTKEMLVGILFAAGCALPAWNRAASPMGTLGLPVLAFGALAWLDCHAIDRWEDDPSACGVSGVAAAACGLGLAEVAMATVLVAHEPRAAALGMAGAASAFLLGLLDRLRRRMTPLALRAVVDLALLTPLALLVW